MRRKRREDWDGDGVVAAVLLVWGREEALPSRIVVVPEIPWYASASSVLVV